jgi:hypothetical protein
MEGIQMKIAKNPTDALKILWNAKFFLKKRNVKDVKSALSKRGYNFIEESLLMALKRANFLTRSGDRGNYFYIQKYPFIEEDNIRKPKNIERKKP